MRNFNNKNRESSISSERKMRTPNYNNFRNFGKRKKYAIFVFLLSKEKQNSVKKKTLEECRLIQ